jgi:hypothetical protein
LVRAIKAPNQIKNNIVSFSLLNEANFGMIQLNKNTGDQYSLAKTSISTVLK